MRILSNLSDPSTWHINWPCYMYVQLTLVCANISEAELNKMLALLSLSIYIYIYHFFHYMTKNGNNKFALEITTLSTLNKLKKQG